MAQVSGHGHSILSRSKAGGGIEAKYLPPSSLEFGPSAFRVSLTSLSRGGEIEISTDTYDFGNKPEQDKPYLVWLADEGSGLSPSVLGFKTEFDEGLSTIQSNNGVIATEQIPANMAQTLVKDHSENGAAILERIETGIDNTLKMLVFRMRYDDFHYINSRAIRTRMSLSTGNAPDVGDTVNGDTNGGSGVVQKVEDNGGGDYTLFFEPNQGTIYQDETDPSNIDIEWDEPMSWHDGTGVNTEGSAQFPTGTYRTFNNKVWRAYPDNRAKNYVNVYLGDGKDPRLTTEGGSTNVDWGDTNPDYEQPDKAYQWVGELIRFRESSAPDANDAYLYWEKDDTLMVDGSRLFISRTSTDPEIKKALYQNQVSNGAQPGSKSHYACVIVDNSWYYVRIRDSVTGNQVVCPIVSWAPNLVRAHLLNILVGDSWTHIALFKDGVMLHEEARP